MAASGRRHRLAWFGTLFEDCQLLFSCPPSTADITSQEFNLSIRVRHKPVIKPCAWAFLLMPTVRSKWGQFNALIALFKGVWLANTKHQLYS
jgi:hypothetical protein